MPNQGLCRFNNDLQLFSRSRDLACKRWPAEIARLDSRIVTAHFTKGKPLRVYRLARRAAACLPPHHVSAQCRSTQLTDRFD